MFLNTNWKQVWMVWATHPTDIWEFPRFDQAPAPWPWRPSSGRLQALGLVMWSDKISAWVYPPGSDSYDICPAGAKLLGMECESITSADLWGLLPSRLKIEKTKTMHPLGKFNRNQSANIRRWPTMTVKHPPWFSVIFLGLRADNTCHRCRRRFPPRPKCVHRPSSSAGPPGKIQVYQCHWVTATAEIPGLQSVYLYMCICIYI